MSQEVSSTFPPEDEDCSIPEEWLEEVDEAGLPKVFYGVFEDSTEEEDQKMIEFFKGVKPL